MDTENNMTLTFNLEVLAIAYNMDTENNMTLTFI